MVLSSSTGYIRKERYRSHPQLRATRLANSTLINAICLHRIAMKLKDGSALVWWRCQISGRPPLVGHLSSIVSSLGLGDYPLFQASQQRLRRISTHGADKVPSLGVSLPCPWSIRRKSSREFNLCLLA